MRSNGVDWSTIDERHWKREVTEILTVPVNEIRRIRPGDVLYQDVVSLRYKGMVESGFLNPRTNCRKEMMLERDIDSIILGLFRKGTLAATLTLNTPTELFPTTAMEMEKQVKIDHPHFNSPNLLEFTKLVVGANIRGMRFVLQMIAASCIIACRLDKRYFWQVGRHDSRDISWREKLGYQFKEEWDFIDASLNNMPSRIGYMDFRMAADDHRVIWFMRRLYRKIQQIEF